MNFSERIPVRLKSFEVEGIKNSEVGGKISGRSDLVQKVISNVTNSSNKIPKKTIKGQSKKTLRISEKTKNEQIELIKAEEFFEKLLKNDDLQISVEKMQNKQLIRASNQLTTFSTDSGKLTGKFRTYLFQISKEGHQSSYKVIDMIRVQIKCSSC